MGVSRSLPLFVLSCAAFAGAVFIEFDPIPKLAKPSGRAETFVPASDSSIWYSGRTRINADGTRDFDWEAVQIWFNVVGATYVKLDVAAVGGFTARLIIETNGWQTASLWVDAANPGPYYVLLPNDGPTWTVRAFNNLEPAFGGPGPNSYLRFRGIYTDGTPKAAGPSRSRRIEFVGDSISAGYGSRGYVGAPDGCKVDVVTSGNYYTYNHQICENFTADCTIIAWSGKGMYENCCDHGERMPSYYLQTLAGESYSTDWDFSRWAPDALIINLGTNDFIHDNGTEWEDAFVATYVEFVLNVTKTHYNAPKMPVFLAQGPMNNNAPLFNSLANATALINAAGGNAHYLDMRGPPCDGCGGHPGVQGHQQMAEMAIPQIAKVMGW